MGPSRYRRLLNNRVVQKAVKKSGSKITNENQPRVLRNTSTAHRMDLFFAVTVGVISGVYIYQPLVLESISSLPLPKNSGTNDEPR
mmetsp:Transcript_28333/g.32591  ORF Transcript_28333/g.32591 Transcript_28333/m.32591 type:complete len:86 (-) Transcript_28333:369-626(-)